MKLIIFFLLLTINLNAQIFVHVGGETPHKIEVPDSLTYEVFEEWKYQMRKSRIPYQQQLRNLKSFEMVTRDFDFLKENKNGIVKLNDELEYYPYCKRAAVLQVLYENNGGEVLKSKRALAIASFSVSDWSEEAFKTQYKRKYIFTYIIRNLKDK